MRLLVALAAVFQIQTFAAGQTCNVWFGPAGGTECICVPEFYDDCQWATCLSNSYIKQKSNDQHQCRDNAFYCWYQCQLEEFDLDEGPVYGKCRCSEGDPIPTPVPPGGNNDNDELEKWCFSPDGSKCHWYRECLEKKYSCEETENGYAISYAEKFCNLYNERASFFTPQGQQWINAVRKCLQVQLVPLMRPYESPPCSEIKQRAFDSHSPCYLNPFPDAPSICDLNCYDWTQVFWTIKGGFTDVFVESLKGTVEVMIGCGKDLSLLGTSCPTVILKLTLVLARHRGRRQIEDQNSRDQLAGEVTQELAKRLRWDPKVMNWFAFAPNVTENTGDPNNVEINIMVGDKIALNLTDQQTSNVMPQFSLENVVRDFAKALEDGHLYDLPVNEGKTTVSTFDACADIQCSETFTSATAGPKARNVYRSSALSTHTRTISIWTCVCITVITLLKMNMILNI